MISWILINTFLLVLASICSFHCIFSSSSSLKLILHSHNMDIPASCSNGDVSNQLFWTAGLLPVHLHSPAFFMASGSHYSLQAHCLRLLNSLLSVLLWKCKMQEAGI